MAMADGALIVFGLFLSLGSGLLLYWFIRTETDQRPIMDRETAEQMARRDTRDEDEQP